ncbi:hypothetical protein GIB67_000652 [Kingdonia uniflora]|uniref:X8 domain-containing protein n=1 Tax=Kingdonia uniflora TaxID=39325 RepID=A0A7J7NDW7_9MAGN|nr:hypothetical protein GIB67_000652 [Kingdonia uniflora]
MGVLVLGVLLLAMMAGLSEANWCICRSDVSDLALQKALDYACGAGADCTPIIQNGPCYQPNTVKGHCSYAANSYFQRKGQTQGTCEFAGAAQVTTSDPSPGGSCTFPSSPSTAGTSSTPVSTTTPPSTTTPSTATPSTTTPTSTFTPPTGGTTTTGGGITTGGGFNSGLGPSGINSADTSDGGLQLHKTNLLFSLLLSLWFSGLLFLWD